MPLSPELQQYIDDIREGLTATQERLRAQREEVEARRREEHEAKGGCPMCHGTGLVQRARVAGGEYHSGPSTRQTYNIVCPKCPGPDAELGVCPTADLAHLAGQKVTNVNHGDWVNGEIRLGHASDMGYWEHWPMLLGPAPDVTVPPVSGALFATAEEQDLQEDLEMELAMSIELEKDAAFLGLTRRGSLVKVRPRVRKATPGTVGRITRLFEAEFGLRALVKPLDGGDEFWISVSSLDLMKEDADIARRFTAEAQAEADAWAAARKAEREEKRAQGESEAAESPVCQRVKKRTTINLPDGGKTKIQYAGVTRRGSWAAKVDGRWYNADDFEIRGRSVYLKAQQAAA